MRSKQLSAAVTTVLVLALPLFITMQLAAQTETVLHNFSNTGTAGYAPASTLTFDSAGNLYGTTGSGGAENAGTIFKLTPAVGGGWSLRFLHSFSPSVGDGGGPGNLTMDAAGNLDGVTSGGGAHTMPAQPSNSLPQADGTWHDRLLHSFSNNGVDGVTPVAGVVLGHRGQRLRR